jgi:hypothetical protein
MHMAFVILTGLLLLSVFLLLGKLWGTQSADIALAARYFISIWLLIALTNMWVGVTKAGYTVAQELPILALVFAVPAIAAAATLWLLARG